jgi:hypothetical protein
MTETNILSGYIEDVRNVFEATENPVVQSDQVTTLMADALGEDGWLVGERYSHGSDQFRLDMLYTDDCTVEASITTVVT